MSEPLENSGGQPALATSSAHLVELLGAIDSVNNKAMFLVGLNLASNSLFVAVIASLDQPWWSAVAPVALAVAAVSIGVWILWPRDAYQFPRPSEMLRARSHGTNDDELAWEVVQVLAPIADEADRLLDWMSLWTSVLAVLTGLQLLCVIATGLALIV